MDHHARKRRRSSSADGPRGHLTHSYDLAIHDDGARGSAHHAADGATHRILIAGQHHAHHDDASHQLGRAHHGGTRAHEGIEVHGGHGGGGARDREYRFSASAHHPGATDPHHAPGGAGSSAMSLGYKDPSSSSGLGGWVDPAEMAHGHAMDGHYAHPGEHQRYASGAHDGWSHSTEQGYLALPNLGQPPHPSYAGHPYSASPYPQATSRWPSSAQGAWPSPSQHHSHFDQPIAHHHQARVSPPYFGGQGNGNGTANGHGYHPHAAHEDEQAAHDRSARQASRQVSASSDDHGSAREEGRSQPRKSSKSGEGARAPVVPSVTPGSKGFVACVPCRQRKIKCNGVRPQCTNCSNKSLPCSYDEVVKRRGPDKQPGGRMRKREGKAQDDSKPARSIKGTAKSNHETTRSAQPDHGDNPHGLGTNGHNINFGATLHPGMSMGIPPSGMHLGAFNSPINSPSVQTRHKFEGMSIDTSRHPYQHPQMLDGIGAIDPALSDPAPPALPSLPSHGPAGVLMPTVTDTQNTFPWLVQPIPSLPEIPQLDVKPVLSANFSPRMALQDLLINGSMMTAQTNVTNDRKTATISPFNDSNEGSDGPVTPPEINIHLERMPNIAYARDQDWVWMTGLLSDQRDQGMIILDARLREVFDMGLSWFACINRAAFFGALHHPVARLELQPALILSLLACSTLFRTGNDGPDHPGRQLACSYADAARSMIQQSIIGNKADPSLAQAALALCIFETCPHPQHSLDRTAGALKQMDSIMQTFCLFAIDVADDRVSIFLPEQVPKLAVAASDQTIDQPVTPQLEGAIVFAGSQPNNVPTPWSPQPNWPVDWTEADMRKDESRRVAWTASAVVATYSAWSQAMGRRPLDLYCAQPENYALFFPAEVLLLEDQMSVVPIGKRTVWALFHRLVLLWHFSIKNAYMGHDPVTRAGIAADILSEVDSIEQCLLSSATQQSEHGNVYRWQSRDWILHIRRLMRYGYGVAQDEQMDKLRGSQWLAVQSQVGHMMANAMNGQAPSSLPSLQNRPMYVWWLLGQAKTACDLYENDNSLDSAVELAGGLWRAIDLLIDKWPCTTAKSVALAFKARFDKILQHQSSLHVSPVSSQ